jgi:hypothetical protein
VNGAGPERTRSGHGADTEQIYIVGAGSVPIRLSARAIGQVPSRKSRQLTGIPFLQGYVVFTSLNLLNFNEKEASWSDTSHSRLARALERTTK